MKKKPVELYAMPGCKGCKKDCKFNSKISINQDNRNVVYGCNSKHIIVRLMDTFHVVNYE